MKLEKFLQDNYNYNPEVKDNIKTYIEQCQNDLFINGGLCLNIAKGGNGGDTFSNNPVFI